MRLISSYKIVGVICMVGLSFVAHSLSPKDIVNITIYTMEDIYPADKFSIYTHNGNIPDFKVVTLTNIEKLEQEVSKGLPNNEKEALSIAQQRFGKYKDQFVKSWQQYNQIHNLNLTHIPAIVFNNGQSIWYGTRLDLAVDAFYRNGGNHE